LTILDLSSNHLSGIPTALSQLTSLLVLDLDSNRFSGTLPEFLASLTQLNELNVRSNSFDGTLPMAFCNMSTNVIALGNEFTCSSSCSAISLGSCVNPTPQPTSPNADANDGFGAGSVSALVVSLFVVVVAVGFLIYRYRQFETNFKDLPLHKLLYRKMCITLASVTENEHTLMSCDTAGRTILEAIFDAGRLDLVSEDAIYFLVEKSLVHHQHQNIESAGSADVGQLNIWAALVQQSDDMSFAVMTKIVSLMEARVDVLAYGTDRIGRRCLDIASLRMKEELLKCLYFLRRFELNSGAAEHKSATSMVIVATDHQSKLPSSKVALKFMKNRDQYLTETPVRRKAQFHEDFVVNVLDQFDGINDLYFLKACQKRGFAEYPFCIVMPFAETSLESVILHRNITGNDWSFIKNITRTLCNALVHVHSKCLMHGDLKPNNIVLADNAVRLIDFDASSSYGEESTDYAGAKYSSGYLPPEMFAVNVSGETCVKRWTRDDDDDDGHIGLGVGGYELIRPSPALDMWSVGVILYQLSTGYQLFPTSVEGHCDYQDHRRISEWSPALKEAKLLKVKDRFARNLLSLLLCKDPAMRLTAERVLTHPFLSGLHPHRLQGEEAEFDVFLSYRVASDAVYAELMYNILTTLELKVWWDKKSLIPGQSWEEGFCSGLSSSSCFVCLLSNNGMFNASRSQHNITKFQSDSSCDNVVLEWRLALDLQARNMIHGIFPVMIADKDDGRAILAGGCHPNQQPVPDCVVQSVEHKLGDYLEKQGLGSPLLAEMTVKEIVGRICEFQGGILKGDVDKVLPGICEAIRQMVIATKTNQVAAPSGFQLDPIETS
jgi:serine/threonine protein kinase